MRLRRLIPSHPSSHPILYSSPPLTPFFQETTTQSNPHESICCPTLLLPLPSPTRLLHLLFVWSTSTPSGRSQTCIHVGELTTSTHTPGHNRTRHTASQSFFCRQYWHLAAKVEKVSFQAVCHMAKDQIQIIKINLWRMQYSIDMNKLFSNKQPRY